MIGDIDLNSLKRVYANGGNIMEYFRAANNSASNSAAAVLYSYDLQAGSYTEALKNPEYSAFIERRASVVETIVNEVQPNSILDVGTGEATALVPLVKRLKATSPKIFAFDVSLSRILYARKYLAKNELAARLFAGTMMHIPFADNSFDVVLTYHSAEPNGGNEDAIVSELLRVTRRRLIMMEPSYELGSNQTRSRIDRLGYVKGLPSSVKKYGYSLSRFELLESWRPDNQTGLLVVDKATTSQSQHQLNFHSPIGRTLLEEREGFYYSAEEGFAFPVIAGIPCLSPENAILVTKLDD